MSRSIHEKAEAAPATPPTIAIKGTMQHREEAIAAKRLALT